VRTNGEVAPFVGHNTFLCWSAVQDASFFDLADNVGKQWCEANVSGDSDLALRLLLNGYTLRMATYSLGGFTEDLLVTVVDELCEVCIWYVALGFLVRIFHWRYE
jgi:hypothetical protein